MARASWQGVDHTGDMAGRSSGPPAWQQGYQQPRSAHWEPDSGAMPQVLDTVSLDPFAAPMRLQAYNEFTEMRKGTEKQDPFAPPMRRQAYNEIPEMMQGTGKHRWPSQPTMPAAPDPKNLPQSNLAFAEGIWNSAPANPKWYSAPAAMCTTWSSETHPKYGIVPRGQRVDSQGWRNEAPTDQYIETEEVDEAGDCLPEDAGTLALEPGMSEESLTTLIIRNIPLKCTQETLLLEWPNNGTYDFFYLPCCCTLKRNKSYAFINFASHDAACQFRKRWGKNRLRNFKARKSLNIGWASLQGLEANLSQLSKNWFWRLKVQGCEPLIFDNGARISLEDACVRLGLQTVELSL